MREDFYETSIGPQNERSQSVFYKIYHVSSVILFIIFGVMLYLLFMIGDFGFVVLSVLSLICAIITVIIKRKLMNFYDYTFVSGEVRIVKVISGKTRRLKHKFESKDVYQVGKVGSETFNKLKATPGIKVSVVTPNGLNAEKQLYYVAVKTLSENTLIILECEEKLLSHIVSYRGSSIIEKDYK